MTSLFSLQTVTAYRRRLIRLDSYAKQTGLNINTFKTLVMYVNATPIAPITVNGDPLEFVDDFTLKKKKKNVCTWAVPSVKTTACEKTSRQDLEKLVVHSPDFVPSGSQNNISLRTQDSTIQQ